ncbi:hypothetical protein EIP91_010155 [Steccherinum ochraceum]|uniref:Uncharacterized protein n=1 Tax=Steccherinum ochraceum TaxID=92696 RepID=A0A4R0RYR7_9APHY|nr:hypothetical protein EIP91_010155 [Steccherinum ochraceum]
MTLDTVYGQFICRPFNNSDNGLAPCSCTGDVSVNGIPVRAGGGEDWPLTADDVNTFRVSLESLQYHAMQGDWEDSNYLDPPLVFAQRYIFHPFRQRPTYQLTLQNTFTEEGYPCGVFHLKYPAAQAGTTGLLRDLRPIGTEQRPSNTARNDAQGMSAEMVAEYKAAFYGEALPPLAPASELIPVVVLNVPLNYVCWSGFATACLPEDYLPPKIRCEARNNRVFQLIASIWKTYEPSHLILTDQSHAIVVSHISTSPDYPSIRFMPPCCLDGVKALRCLIGAALNCTIQCYFSPNAELFPPVSGVMNRPSAHPIAVNAEPQNFTDFDLYTMQRHLQDLRAFLRWKADQIHSPRIGVNHDLTIKVHAFEKKEATLSFCLPLEDPPPSELDEIVGSRRPRQTEVDAFLSTQAGVRFKVSNVFFPPDAMEYSQHYLGHLERLVVKGTRHGKRRIWEPCNARVRLTLFDERFFPMPPDRKFLDDHDTWDGYCVHPSLRFRGDLVFALDLMRHEHAAYHRLQSLQGSLLPHCYGFHSFQMRGGPEVYGFLTEDVQGLPPSPQVFSDLTSQRRLVRTLHLVRRTLLYKGVRKVWSGDSIIATRIPADVDDVSGVRVVVRDFASGRLRLGREKFVPGVREFLEIDVDKIVKAEVEKIVKASMTKLSEADVARIDKANKTKFSLFKEGYVAEVYAGDKNIPWTALRELGFMPTEDLLDNWCSPPEDDHEQW